MLTNATIGGGLVGIYAALLLLQVNPSVPLAAAPARAIAAWILFYGIHATVFFYVVIVIRQVLAAEMRSPGWLSLRLLAQFGTLAMTVAAVVTWLNLRGFRGVLEPDAALRMTRGALVLTICAGLAVVLMLVQLPLARGRRVVAALFVSVVIASILAPACLRGKGGDSPPARRALNAGIAATPSSARLTMILLDGASLDYIAPAAVSGRVPNFGRLLEGGAVMHLATLLPTQPAPVWTAVATGKLPYKTAVYSAARYHIARSATALDLLPDFCFSHALSRFGLLSEEPPSADAVRARPIWALLDSFGITSGIVNWPVTYPADAVHGYVVSDEFLRRQDWSMIGRGHDEAPLVWPEDLLDFAREARSRADQDPMHASDAADDELAREIGRTIPVQFRAVRYPGLDAVGHYYLRYAMPRAFGDVSAEERARFGRVLDEYYAYIDAVVGRAANELAPGDLLLVVSGFGMEPLSFGKRLLERVVGDRQLSGTHEGAPDGFLIAYGRDVASGSFPRASVVDVAPTVLYFFGLPIARDMDGYARTDIFTPAFTDLRPITFIPQYDH